MRPLRYALLAALLAPALALPSPAPPPTVSATGASPAVSATADRWRWPLPAPHVLRGFRAPATPYAAGHRGIDLAAEPGVVVAAPADGVVAFAGRVADRPVVTLAVDGLLVSLEPVDPAVAAGDRVARGQAVGRAGSGGHCDGRCLHVGVRRDGDYLSPLLLFATVERAVLLPLP